METTCCFLTTTTTPLSKLLPTHRKYEDGDEGGGQVLNSEGTTLTVSASSQHKELIDYYDAQPKHNDDRLTDMILDNILLYKQRLFTYIMLLYVVVTVEIYCNFKLHETNVILTGISFISPRLDKVYKIEGIRRFKKNKFESRNFFIRLSIQNRYRIL